MVDFDIDDDGGSFPPAPELSFAWKEGDVEVGVMLSASEIWISWTYVHNCCGIQSEPWEAYWIGHPEQFEAQFNLTIQEEVRHKAGGREISATMMLCILCFSLKLKQTYQAQKAMLQHLRVQGLFVKGGAHSGGFFPRH